ncbi:RNA polymerase sigma factor [Spirosoma soli]|uniref:RNA polymerase sigma factor n=1 Tax=Spirosoma soli TaxID=1770529 RepID=A0ABW5M2L9_9BACT
MDPARQTSIHSKEHQLWTRFRTGDVSAFETLMTTHFRVLFHYGSKFSKDPEFVKDCIQDLFLYLWEHRTSLNTDIALKPYLMASLRRHMHRSLPIVPFVDECTTNQVSNATEAFILEFSVEETLIEQESSRERARQLTHFIDLLPHRQKEVIYLKFFQEMDRNDIAEVMNVAPQTVSNLIQLALKQLRQHWTIKVIILLLSNCLLF